MDRSSYSNKLLLKVWKQLDYKDKQNLKINSILDLIFYLPTHPPPPPHTLKLSIVLNVINELKSMKVGKWENKPWYPVLCFYPIFCFLQSTPALLETKTNKQKALQFYSN